MQTLAYIGTLIVRTRGSCGERARISGSRITVQYIVTEIKAGITSEEILEDKTYLTLARIYSALAHYYANKELLDAEFAAYEEEYPCLETGSKIKSI